MTDVSQSSGSEGSSDPRFLDRKDGRIARPDTPQSRKTPVRVRKSTLLGIYLYRWMTGILSEQQKAYIAHFQGRLNDQQIIHAQEFAQKLLNSPRTRARVSADARRVPSLPERTTVAPKRHIGVGYRDKGYLRPLHERGRSVGERTFWPEDLLGPLVPRTLQLPDELLSHWDLVELVAEKNPGLSVTTAELALRTLVTHSTTGPS